jgi:tetratricopeptide (TPR) repeat protein
MTPSLPPKIDAHRTPLWIALGVMVLSLLVWGIACRNDFVNFDDTVYVYDNSQVKTGLTPNNIIWSFTTFHESNWHPLTWLSLQLDATVFGPGPFGFHLTNVLLHVAATGLLYFFLVQATAAPWRAAVVAALFALHPLHVESVAWISERKDVLCAVFWMLGLLAYRRYVEQPGWGRYVLVLLALAAALLAKPMAVTFPCVLLLLDYWPLARPESWRRLVLEKIPLFVLVAVFCLTTILAQSTQAIMSVGAISGWARVSNAVVAYCAYLKDVVWPFQLIPFYPHPRDTLPLWEVMGCAAVLVGITAVCVANRVRFPYLLVGWLWYLGTLVPVIGLIQVGGQGRADRYTYLPLIGVFIALVWGCADWVAARPGRTWVWHRVAGAVVAAVVIGCSVLTYLQIGFWQNSQTLWERTVAVDPHNHRGWHMLGFHYKGVGRAEDAVKCFTAACRDDPTDFRFRKVLIAELLLQNRIAEAQEHAQEALRIPGTRSQEELYLCYFAIAEGSLRRGDFREAIRYFHEALSCHSSAVAHGGLGLALAKDGKMDAAIPHFQIAHQEQPNNPTIAFNLALALSSRGKWAEALVPLQQAASVAPGSALYQSWLARGFLALQKEPEARLHAQQAAKLQPQWVADSIKLIWQTVGKPLTPAHLEDAVLLARVVCISSEPPLPEALDALAASQACSGHFTQAVATAGEAAAGAERAGKTELAAAIRTRQASYQNRELPALKK